MDPLILTTEMITVFAIQGLVIVLLVFNLLRVDVAGLLVMTHVQSLSSCLSLFFNKK